MPPRADDPPRRGPESRRGAARSSEPPLDDDSEPGRGFGSIGDARAYTPRGRTVRDKGERGRAPRTDRTGDPFRPALQVLDGGQPAPRDRRRSAEPPPAPPRLGRDTDDHDNRYDHDHDHDERRVNDRRGGNRTLQDREPSDHVGRDRAAVDRAERRRGDDIGRRGEPARRGETGQRAEPGRRAAEVNSRRTTSVARGGVRRPPPAGRTTTGRGRGDAAARPADDGRRATRRIPAGRPGRLAGPPRPPAGPPAEPPSLADSRRRLRLGTAVALALFAAIGIRLVSFQALDNPAVAASILEQRESRLHEVALPAPRGSILDRNDAVLAHSVEARFIYADPERVKDPVANANALSPLLGIPASTLRALMAKKARPGGGPSHFEFLARGVEISTADKIVQLNLPGIGARRDERRDVPGADLAANLIGFTGDGVTGLEGLEARYDDLLRGRDGKRIFEIGNPYVDKGQLAKEIPGGYNRETPAQPGSSLQLTIDRDLQYEVERLLGEDMRRINATVAAAVVLDVRSGEVLAQASYPPWDAARPFDVDKPADREDIASSMVADPGSSHKAFIFGAALQEGIIKPDSTLVIGPALRRGGYQFKDTHPQRAGTRVTMPGLLAYSSNVGTILLADKLTPQRVYEYQQKFGLGKATGEGMPGEAEGRLLPPAQWSPSGSGSIPIGHSVDATLIQMAAGYGAIANDGTYVQPHLIKATIAADGTRTPAPPPQTRPVLSPQNAAALRTMMEAVVSVPGATGNLAKVPGYRVAGKTGTGKRLINGRYTSYEAGSFIGMAPAENPRYVIAVFADTPGGGGGAVAGPAFSKMMSFTLTHYKVPPSGTKPPKFTILP